MTLLVHPISRETGATPDPAADVHASIERLAERDFDLMDADSQAVLLESVVRAEARLAAVRLRVLAAADRGRAAVASGAASTGQWAARIAHADQADVHRQVGLAQGLDRRPATQRALGAGAISPEHAAVILHADQQLPREVTPSQRQVIESSLIQKAQELSPSSLRRVARRAVEEVEPDIAVVDAHENALIAEQEARARARVRLSLHENEDGTVTGHFTVPALQGQLLRKILQTMTAPRRGRLGSSIAQIGEREARTDWDRARGEAFCELIEHLPTDRLHSRTAATLVVSIAEDALREALRVAKLDTGGVISAGEARRLACNCGIMPAVYGGASVPLDLGRGSRLFSESQRIALGLAHSTCAADGCERPYSWCELHHLVSWASGGATDLANAVPLCHFHHQRIHDHRYHHERLSSGAIRFRLRT